jgi:hypothetical protein
MQAAPVVFYSPSMIDAEKLYPVLKLKQVSVAELENAIATALNELAGVGDNDTARLTADVHTMIFSNDQHLNLEISIETMYLTTAETSEDGLPLPEGRHGS